MIKQLLHKVSSVVIAFLVLFSTVSFTVEKHYCGKRLVDVALFSEAQGCSMDMSQEMLVSMKKNCCKDTIDILKGQEDLLSQSFDKLDFETQVFIAAFTVAFLNSLEVVQEQNIPHLKYMPPDLVYEIHIIDQVFLI